MAPPRVAVLLPFPFDHAFTYAAPSGLEPEAGAVVTVPLGRRMVQGVVWDEPGDDSVAERRLKP
ncbi:MAG: hypothetical protein ACREFT_15450, partial [Acetobacteraceae bacterium]